MTISVIIPALNEAGYIERTLASVKAQSGPIEILVVDGGSADATRERVAAEATVITAPPGRAIQMNEGARHTTGEVLFFLHADTLLPGDAFTSIRTALAIPSVEAGAFRLRFDPSPPLLQCYSWCTHLKSPGLCFGDRGLFVRRSVFDAVGGFASLPLFEDLDIVRRLHRRGGFRFLKPYVTTAARRFEHNGPLRQQLRNVYLWLHYISGTDPHRLTQWYPYEKKKA